MICLKRVVRKKGGGLMTILARAAVARSCKDKLRWEEIEVDDPRPCEMHVRILACGICHTDIAVQEGHMDARFPCVLGHEGVGVVERVGASVTRFKPGDRVLLSFRSCGSCKGCLSGYPARCDLLDILNWNWGREDGTTTLWDSKGHSLAGNFFGQSSFSSQVLTHERNAIPLDGSDEEVMLYAPLGCGFQAGAGTVLHELKPKAGQSLAVFGVGAVGLAAVMAGAVLGANPIIALDKVHSRLDLAKDLGAHVAININQEPIENSLPTKVHTAVETTGSSQIINQAIRSLKARGKISLLAIRADEAPLIQPSSYQRVVESIAGDSNPQTFIPSLIALYKEGVFPFDRLVRFYPAKDINKAIRDSLLGKTIKPVIRF